MDLVSFLCVNAYISTWLFRYEAGHTGGVVWWFRSTYSGDASRGCHGVRGQDVAAEAGPNSCSVGFVIIFFFIHILYI